MSVPIRGASPRLPGPRLAPNAAVSRRLTSHVQLQTATHHHHNPKSSKAASHVVGATTTTTTGPSLVQQCRSWVSAAAGVGCGAPVLHDGARRLLPGSARSGGSPGGGGQIGWSACCDLMNARGKAFMHVYWSMADRWLGRCLRLRDDCIGPRSFALRVAHTCTYMHIEPTGLLRRALRGRDGERGRDQEAVQEAGAQAPPW